MIQRKRMLIVCEGNDEGLLEVSKQLLSKARFLCDAHSMNLSAVLLNSKNDLAEESLLYGSEETYLINHELLKFYTAQAYTEALVQLIQYLSPSIVLFGATDLSRDLAACCAARLRTGLTAFCTELDIDPKTLDLLQTRPAYGGQVMATITTMNSSPQMATVKPGVFEIRKMTDVIDKTKISQFDPDFTGFAMLSHVLTITHKITDEQSLDHPIVIGCGSAIKDTETLQLIHKLALMTKASVAASRKAVESGLFKRESQVGLTGKTIRPKVYLALGISGAVQHLEGIKESKLIIAVNTDPSAPIFEHADYGIVMDVKDFLVKMISLIENQR